MEPKFVIFDGFMKRLASITCVCEAAGVGVYFHINPTKSTGYCFALLTFLSAFAVSYLLKGETHGA